MYNHILFILVSITLLLDTVAMNSTVSHCLASGVGKWGASADSRDGAPVEGLGDEVPQKLKNYL